MTEYIESNLKININSDFNYKFDNYNILQNIPLKKCDFICKYEHDNNHYLILVEAKEVGDKSPYRTKQKAENKIKGDILRKIIESIGMISIWGSNDYHLSETKKLLQQSEKIFFIFILNDFSYPLANDQIISLLEILRTHTRSLNIEHLIICSTNKNFKDLITISRITES